MTDHSVNVLKAIILYLDETGFDFDKNSANDLINAMIEIGSAALKDPAIKGDLQEIIDELNEVENYA